VQGTLRAPENAMAKILLRVLSVLLLAPGLAGLAAADDPDPPARVGRASLVEGDVAYAHDGAWTRLPLNWPLTTGARLSAAPGARAELRVGSTAIRLAEATELEVVRLDDDAIALRLLRGTIDVRVRTAEVARELAVETPEGRVVPLAPGRLRVDAGLEADTTAVSADGGSARIEAAGNALVVRPGTRVEVSRNGDSALAAAQPDAFDEWARARDRRYDASPSARYVSPETTGYEALDEHGDWREVSEYGAVWVPRAVPVGWAPYRTGRWAWVAPWGWTWIDEAPWGFAPFHYGRWAFVGGIWCWVPGRFVARPVYAPALVGWIGRPGWSVTVSVGSVPAVGWFPLAPREVYVPAHRHSPAYVRNVNVTHVTNVAHVTNVNAVTNVNYAHRRNERAVTVVPAAAVTRGEPVGRAQVRVHRADLDRHAPASPTPPTAAIAPPRPAPTRADDRAPHRRGEPDPRGDESTRAARRAGPVAQQVPAGPTTPPAPPGPVEGRPAPRHERAAEAQRPEPPRAIAPAVPAPAQARAEARPVPRPESRGESRRAAQQVERAQPVASGTPPAGATGPGASRTIEVRPEPRPEPRRELPRAEMPRPSASPAAAPPPQRAQPRFEPRPPMPRVEPPRAAAPTSPAPMPAPAPPRVDTRPAPTMPAVRAAPPASPPAAVPAPPRNQAAPRGAPDRGQGREQRREGRGTG